MSYLELDCITKLFGPVLAADDVCLSIEKGELVSLLGPSGCGKTTTLRIVAGFENPTSGRVRLDGEDITDVRPSRRNIGMVFQSYALFPNMNVADNVGFGLDMRHVSREEKEARIAEMLDLVGLGDLADRYVHQLSGGQQQRVALARALAIRPRVLLLDEPLSALDAKVRLGLRNEIRRIQKELAITAVYVTHDQEEALNISDRVVVMNEGHVEQVGTPTEIYDDPRTPFVATFVGTVNSFAGQVVDARRGLVKVEDCVLQMDEEAARYLQETGKDEVVIAIRPERISLTPEQGHNHLTVAVEQISFLGALVQIMTHLGNLPLTLVHFNLTRHPEVGEDLDVYFAPEAMKILAKDDGHKAVRE